jgi:peptide/nickel transport system substrate-binding protein
MPTRDRRALDRPNDARRLSRRRFLLLSGIGGSAALLVACQAAAPAAPPSKPAEAQKPAEQKPTAAPAKPAEAAKPPEQKPAAAAPAVKPESGGELIVAGWDEPISLDPAMTNVSGLNSTNLLYDTLVVQSNDGKYHPALAESWEASADGKTYTFKLKRGPKFHDGTPVNAEAVKFSLDRVTAPTAKANFTITLAGVYGGTEVVDEATARVTLKQPYAPFLTAVADGYFAAVSPTAVEKFGKDFDRNPVGSGPYIFEEWASKSHVALKKNPDYAWGSSFHKHQGAGYSDRVSIRLIPDGRTRMATVETGEVHIAEEIPPDEIERLRTDPKVQVLAQVAPGTGWQLQINTTQPPTDELAVRQAIEYAVNQAELVKVLFKDTFKPSQSIIVPGTIGNTPTLSQVYGHNPAKAQEVLGQAGWAPGGDGIRTRGGKRLEVSIDIISAGIQTLPIKLAELLQAQFREVGIHLNIKQYDTAGLFAAMNEGQQQMIYGRRAGPDPDVLRPLLHSAGIGKGPVQRTRYKDEQLDKLLEEGAQETDPAKRPAIYKDIQDIVFKQALLVPLWDFQVFVAARSNVQGLALDPRGYLQLYDVWVAKS